MTVIQVYDPALCCNSGVCGSKVDPELVNFAAAVDWAKKQGVSIERFNLSQQPLAFAQNETVKKFLERSGADSLPLILMNNDIVLAGRYPTRKELAQWTNIASEQHEVGKKCCGSQKECC